MNEHEIDRIVYDLPHLQELATALACAQADAGIGLWPRPTVTLGASEVYAGALAAYRTEVKEAQTLLQDVAESIQTAYASADAGVPA